MRLTIAGLHHCQMSHSLSKITELKPDAHNDLMKRSTKVSFPGLPFGAGVCNLLSAAIFGLNVASNFSRHAAGGAKGAKRLF